MLPATTIDRKNIYEQTPSRPNYCCHCIFTLIWLKGKKVKGKLVSSSEPTKKEGIYWGYKTRLANNLTAVLNEPNTVKDDGSAGYDCVVGTSDKGDSVDNFELPKFKWVILLQWLSIFIPR